MPFTDEDVTQIRAIIKDELRTAAVDIYEWRSSDKREIKIYLQPAAIQATYTPILAPELLDQIATALAERLSARFR
jgi:hypothetical protein